MKLHRQNSVQNQSSTPPIGSPTAAPPSTGAAGPNVADDRFERDGSELLALMNAALKPTAEDRQALSTWLDYLNALPADAPGVGVNTHSALIFLRRMNICEGDACDRLDEALQGSWRRLTGDVPKDLEQRLPRRVLFRASRDEKDLHAAAFQTGDRKQATADAQLLRDYTPESQDAAYALSAVLVALTETGADMLTGGVAGLLIATVGESLLHDLGGHPTGTMKTWTQKPGHLQRRFRQAAVGHLHAHHATFRDDYGVMFDSPEAKAKLDAKLDQIKADDPAIDIDVVKDEDYGLTVSNRKMPGFAQPYVVAATAATITAAVAGFDLSTAGVLTMYAFSVLPPFASKLLHPHLHKPRAQALEDASPPMRRLLESRLVELMDKLHFGHHRGRYGNFNLVTPIGDKARTQLKLPTVSELLKMRESKKWPRAEFHD